MDLWIYNVVFLSTLYQVMLSKTEETKEFCHNERKTIVTGIDCDVRHITITVEGDPNHVDQCDWNQGKMWCINGNYDNTNKSLTFSFTFNLEHHAGKQMVIHSRCNNGRHVNETYIMIPCPSEFTVFATHNKEHINLTCQHKFFNMSSDGIHIKKKEEDDFIVTCTWNKGISKTLCQTKEQGHAHKNGIDSYTAEYPGEYQCVMGGQIIDIPSREVSTSTEVPTSQGITTQEPSNLNKTRNASRGTSSGCRSKSFTQLDFLIPLFIMYCTYSVQYFRECGYSLLPS
ncbi:uncharacterized protein LOC134275933 isoform X1 [Saccostrea cucullata]|uniref:uncharacterized protein LOC134275933 isoform X1 n=1 Tax=Saccostrea cuccullata TaxID=36930 RepID=UPI002ED2BB49